MIHELRIYHCVPGRLPDVVSRFESAALAFFEKYGIKHIGFWTVLIGASSGDFIYLLEWESLADREQKWNSMQTDADWLRTRRDTEANGPIIASVTNTILQPTTFSTLR